MQIDDDLQLGACANLLNFKVIMEPWSKMREPQPNIIEHQRFTINDKGTATNYKRAMAKDKGAIRQNTIEP